MTTSKCIHIIGGGSAALFLAAQLDARHEVHLYERSGILGRKFLVAGKGGFNLTNSAEGTDLLSVYSPQPKLRQAVSQYDSRCFRRWLAELGVPTYVGSSGRVFPEVGIKPVAVRDALRQRLHDRGVHIHLFHDWKGVDAEGQLCFDHRETLVRVAPDTVVLALGGASWSKTGSDGAWMTILDQCGIPMVPFAPSNCGVNITWDADFLQRFDGSPLKNIALQINNQVAYGEALITRYGLEGNALYPLVPALRHSLQETGKANLLLNLKPYNSLESLHKKVSRLQTKPKNYAYSLKVSKAALGIAKQYTTKTVYIDPLKFAHAIQQLQIPIEGLRPIDEAISTVGGIPWSHIGEYFALNTLPNWYAIGEMVDWDAPTGGFLLQGCFSMAATCAHYFNQ